MVEKTTLIKILQVKLLYSFQLYRSFSASSHPDRHSAFSQSTPPSTMCSTFNAIAHLPAEFFERLALRLKRLHQRDAVAEPFADAFLDQFVHHGVRQLVAFNVKVMQNQLPLDQLLLAVL